MTNRQKFAEAFGYEIMWRDTGEPVPGHCKILIAESEQFDEWLNQEYEPPAQPEPEEFEWCHTCREYDQEKHCCHRWTKVIRKTVDDMKAAQPGWIPCSESPMKNNSYLVWMPFAPEGHHITVAEWCGSYWNIKTPIMAWMPLPTPYREGGQDNGSD